MTNRATEEVELMKSLVAHLSRAARVVKLAKTDASSAEDVASEAAGSLVDIQRSCGVLFRGHLINS